MIEPAKCANPSCPNRVGEGGFVGELCSPCHGLTVDSGEKFLGELDAISREDAEGLKRAYESYGPSWKQRGGVGAYMMACRKFDRLENRVRKLGWDVFRAIAEDDRGEGCIDDVRDLRRYLMLIEAEMRARGFRRTHRDNKP